MKNRMEFFSRTVAFFLILILTPLLLLIIIFSIILQGNPVLFKQKRVGKNFKIFCIYKFRTMVNNSSGGNITYGDDVRITTWGKFLRSYKIDELPQLFNILKGEMRFIGPRPEVKEYVDKNSFSFLLSIKPGLSDYASILFRNEEKILEKSNKIDPYKNVLEIKTSLANYYVEKKGFFEDLRLVFLTLFSIFSKNIAVNYIHKNILTKEQIKKFKSL
jgi:lipopolysaccharide/colanic/teichoic acid biosynthesis glycosyltransferase